MESVLGKFIDKNSERINFGKYGFKYVDVIDRFVLDGYGAWITNIDSSDKERFSKYVETSEWLTSLVEDGCELVVGPAAPADNGIVYDFSCGVYIKNYLERMHEMQVLTGKEKVSILRINKHEDSYGAVSSKSNVSEKDFSEEKEKVVLQAIRLANKLRIVQMHCGMGLNLGNVYDEAIDSVYAFEKETSEKYTDDELYSIIQALEEIPDEKTISHMVGSLRNALFDRIMSPVEIHVTDQVIDLVAEARRLSNNYHNISVHTGLGYNLNSEYQGAQDAISSFVSKVLVEASDLEIICFMDKFEESYKGQRHCTSSTPRGAQFIINSIRNDFQRKSLDSHFSEKGQQKEKK